MVRRHFRWLCNRALPTDHPRLSRFGVFVCLPRRFRPIWTASPLTLAHSAFIGESVRVGKCCRNAELPVSSSLFPSISLCFMRLIAFLLLIVACLVSANASVTVNDAKEVCKPAKFSMSRLGILAALGMLKARSRRSCCCKSTSIYERPCSFTLGPSCCCCKP